MQAAPLLVMGKHHIFYRIGDTNDYTFKPNNRHCRICKTGFRRDPKLNQHLPDNHACESCRHWVEQAMTGDGIIINREHYRRGVGGGIKNAYIRHDNGRTEFVRSLWHQGRIPCEFDAVLPDNARWNH